MIRRDEAKDLLGADVMEGEQETSERLEMLQMTREERRQLLEQSVTESVSDYELDNEWLAVFCVKCRQATIVLAHNSPGTGRGSGSRC